jgi:hypothetical protein
MSENINEGNDPIEKVEDVKIGDHTVSMKTTGVGKDAKIEIETPVGLEGYALKAFEEKAKPAVVSAMALANKKGFETNKRAKELDVREAKLRQREEEAILKESSKKLPTLTELAIAESGLSKEDYYDLYPEERDVFRDKALVKISEMKSIKSSKDSKARDFIAKGGDYNDLDKYGKSLGAPISDALINSYNRINEKEAKKFVTTDLADLQSGQITFVKKGGIAAGGKETMSQRLVRMGNEKKRL